MILGRLVVGESVVEDRQEDEVAAHSPSKRAAAEGQQGREWSNSVHIHQQRHSRHAG